MTAGAENLAVDRPNGRDLPGDQVSYQTLDSSATPQTPASLRGVDKEKPEANALVSDLEGCYHDLLAGVGPEALAGRYVRFEVLAAQELYGKGATLEELRLFHERQAARFKFAPRAKPIVCKGYGDWMVVEGRTEKVHVPCDFMAFDDAEFRRHVRLNPGPLHIARKFGRHGK